MTDFVATVIARSENADALAETAGACGRAFAATHSDVLAPREAMDLFFAASASVDTLRQEASRLGAGRPVDIAVQPIAARRKRLLVADMDSTIIGQECIDELADFAGLKAKVAAITERAMRGEIEFEPALRERVALLAGLPATTINTVLTERIRLTPGAVELVATMRANGAYALLVSGGFTAFATPIAAKAGFDESRANELLVQDGHLTGKVAEPILGRADKLQALQDAIVRLGISAGDALAVGDGANDLGMIRHAGLGVAYHAKPKVAEAAGAHVDHGDLTALLYLQGYHRNEFVRQG
jgi:phosphoserine phosphatase